MNDKKISSNKLKSFTFFLILSVIFYFGNIISINAYGLQDKIENKWIIILFVSVILIFSVSIYKFKYNKANFLLAFIWIVFIIFIFLSKFAHSNFQLMEFILYCIIIPIVFFGKGILKYKNVFLIASVFSIIPLLSYLGKSNTLGLLLAMAGISLLNILKLKNYPIKYIYISIVLFSFLISITESRTSLLTFFIVSTISVISTLKLDNMSYLKIIKNVAIVLFFFLLLYFSFGYISDLFFNKWGANTQVNITSGRSEIWLITLQEGISLLGNGENYFLNTFNSADSHNTFIQVLGEYGLLCAILLSIIFIYILFKSIRLHEKIDYLCFFCGFFILSLTENLFFINSRLILINLLFFMYLGCLIHEKKTVK